MALFDKNYNKWHICEDNSKLWHPEYPKGKFLVLTSMVEKYDFFDTYEDVVVNELDDWDAHSILFFEGCKWDIEC